MLNQSTFMYNNIICDPLAYTKRIIIPIEFDFINFFFTFYKVVCCDRCKSVCGEHAPKRFFAITRG